MKDSIRSTAYDMIGKKFSNVLVLNFSHRNRFGQRVFNCRCDCGIISQSTTSNIRSKTRSKTKCWHQPPMHYPTYRSWYYMIDRCYNKANSQYKNYGARGIIVCKEWLSYEKFLSDMGKKPNWGTIDRIDNDGNYCKENCKWSTYKEQANNRSNNRVITFDNKTMNITQWAKLLGVNRNSFQSRLDRGFSFVEAATMQYIYDRG